MHCECYRKLRFKFLMNRVEEKHLKFLFIYFSKKKFFNSTCLFSPSYLSTLSLGFGKHSSRIHTTLIVVLFQLSS